MPVIPRYRYAFAVLALGALCGPAAQAQDVSWLVGVRWQAESDLSRLEAAGGILRHVAPGLALLSVGDAGLEALQEAGWTLAFSDGPPAGAGYYLADHLHAGRAPAHAAVVHRDPAGWALLRLPRDRVAEALDGGYFLYPLPERYAEPAAAPAARPAARAPSAAVRTLLDEVDPGRLQDHVERLSFVDPSVGAMTGNVRTRYARRPETFASTEYIRDRLTEVLGTSAVTLDSFRIVAGDSLMFNVVGELPGTDPGAGYWVICAHYDAIGTRSRRSDLERVGEQGSAWDWRRHPAPGADDNASGVALVLESARLLAALRFPWSIRFIAFSGEELGLWGSKHYATAARGREDGILGVLNFDMVGFNDRVDRLELVTNPSSAWLVGLMRDTDDRYGLGLQLDVLEDRFAGLSDHQPFWVQGYDAVLGIENYLPTDSTSAGVVAGDYRINTQYHTVADLPDSINWDLVARVTRLTVATLAQFAAEQGLPNLAVFDGDLRPDDGGDLRVRIANLGPADHEGPFDLRLWRCAPDSTACTVVFEGTHPGPVAAGGVAEVTVPWKRYGDSVFLVEIDPAGVIEEEVEIDNRAFVGLRLRPRDGVVVFPNPFRPGRDGFARFFVPEFSRLRIYDHDGTLVWQQREEDAGGADQRGEIRWRGVNTANRIVGSGIYLYDLRAFEGELLRRGKIAVVR